MSTIALTMGFIGATVVTALSISSISSPLSTNSVSRSNKVQSTSSQIVNANKVLYTTRPLIMTNNIPVCNECQKLLDSLHNTRMDIPTAKQAYLKLQLRCHPDKCKESCCAEASKLASKLKNEYKIGGKKTKKHKKK
jgi:hypothetical protein